MAIRNAYSDTFTGEADENIREILFGSEGNKKSEHLKRVLVRVVQNELTPRQKEVIEMYYFRRMNITEIGEVLEITPQAVSALMSRARLKIFRILRYYVQ